MERLNSVTNPCFQQMLSFIPICKNQPDSYIHIIRIFLQNVFLQKNALQREHNFLQKYFDFCETFFMKGPLFQNEEFTLFICMCSPLWVGKGLSSSPGSVWFEARLYLLFASQVIGAATVTGFCDSYSDGVVTRINSRALPHCSQKQDSCLVFHWWQLCY